MAQEDEAVLEAEARNAATVGTMSVFQLLASSRFWRSLIIGLGLQMSQQLSGINIAFNYSSIVFEDANVKNADIATALVGKERGGWRLEDSGRQVDD
jgi:hypothetical protein